MPEPKDMQFGSSMWRACVTAARGRADGFLMCAKGGLGEEGFLDWVWCERAVSQDFRDEHRRKSWSVRFRVLEKQ